MPDAPYTKFKPQLSSLTLKGAAAPPYVELQVTSNFSFLRGGSHPEEYIEQAAKLGYRGIGLTDLNSLAGVVRAHSAAKQIDLPFYVGARLALGHHAVIPCSQEIFRFSVLAYPTSRKAYGSLCKLLTLGKRRAQKGECLLALADLAADLDGLLLILVPPNQQYDISNEHICDLTFLEFAEELKQRCPDKDLLSIALTKSYNNSAQRRLESTLQIARKIDIPLVVCNDLHYHIPERKPLQDILSCIREKCTIQQAGFGLFQNRERYLKSPAEIYHLYREFPAALRRTLHLAERCRGFSLSQLRYEYPAEICPNGKSAKEYLAEIAWQGAHQKYRGNLPLKVQQLLKQELELINQLEYEKYFLTCFDIVRFARSRGILCQGRGAAANSAVCYCLGITAVDPTKIDLLFARFVSKERNEPPDIDIDFEHERREEVIQYIYQKFGRERAGLTCEVVTYRQRSAIRDVGKALGLSLEIVDKLAKSIHRWTASTLQKEDLIEIGLNPDDLTVQNCITLSKELLGFPRHLSQHVGGFIISEKLLCETVPIGNAAMPERTIIEWDKDDIEELGMLKIDVLALGMLSCIRKALFYINKRRLHENKDELTFYNIPSEDPGVYQMLCRADSIGVFQVESRAQMSMLPRLKPRCFYDLVIEVAIVRPGPIQGNMVHPYLKRRKGLEKVTYPDKRVAEILGKTMGVPIFQEQAMRLAIVLAKFSPGEAEQLRRAMSAWKRDKGVIALFKERIVKGMLANGYTEQFAETCMNQIKGFSEYGFPESHAASFAILVYISAWLKRYYPAEFAAALLNSQPMGFYAPSQIVSDAKEHGVTIRPIDINQSGWDHSLEENNCLRLGMRLVKGLAEKDATLVVQAVKSYGEFTSIAALWQRTNKTGLGRAALLRLARADAFRSLGLGAREAYWEIKALRKEILPFDLPAKKQLPTLPYLPEQQAMFNDYQATGLSLRGHPVGLLRENLTARGVSSAYQLKNQRKVPCNTFVGVAGIAIIRQRPGTAKGVVFITLEDESGVTNLLLKPDIFERYSKLVLSSSALLAYGKLERIGEVVYVDVQELQKLDLERSPKRYCRAYPRRNA